MKCEGESRAGSASPVHHSPQAVPMLRHCLAAVCAIAYVQVAREFGILHAKDDWRPLQLIDGGKVAADWKHVGFGKLVVDEGAVRTDCDERGLGLAVWTKEKL